MRFRNTFMTLMGGLLLLLAGAGAQAQAAREEGILLESAQVLEELRATPERAIPNRLLERAYGIAIFPGLLKAAFFVGGRHGDGVFIMRDKDGRFTSPFFISMTGASFGFQFGGQKEDIVLVFTTRRGVEGVTGGKVTLGGDASVAVGPVGRDASASTDVGLAEVYSYSRAKGLFAGLALDGSVITVDSGSNAAFYKKHGVLASEIAEGAVKADYDATRRFMRAVSAATGGGDTTTAAAEGSPPLPPPAPAPSGPAQAYPLTSETPPPEAQAGQPTDPPHH
jgi:lipid-binding SYLF domain-containing protein